VVRQNWEWSFLDAPPPAPEYLEELASLYHLHPASINARGTAGQFIKQEGGVGEKWLCGPENRVDNIVSGILIFNFFPLAMDSVRGLNLLGSELTKVPQVSHNFNPWGKKWGGGRDKISASSLFV